MWFCVTTITGEVDSFQSDPLKPKGKHFYISCFVSLSLSLSRRFCVLLLPRWPRSWTLLLTGLWWASEDKNPFLSFLHPGSSCLEKTHTCQKNASLVQKGRFTHKPVGLKLSWKCQWGWHFQNNSKNARTRENAEDFLLLFEHYSGSHSKWCQLFLMR